MNWKLLKSKCRTLQCHSLKSFFKIHVRKHCIFMPDFPFNVRVISKSLKKRYIGITVLSLKPTRLCACVTIAVVKAFA